MREVNATADARHMMYCAGLHGQRAFQGRNFQLADKGLQLIVRHLGKAGQTGEHHIA